MRIEQQQQKHSQQGIIELIQQNGAAEQKKEVHIFGDAVKAEKSKNTTGVTSVNAGEVTYLNPAKEEKETVLDDIEQSNVLDAGERKDQMAVLAETTSPEDYAKMSEEGFSLDDTTSNTIVTVTDKIKAQLAKAGVDISIFGDELSMDQLAQITGSTQLAAQLARSLREADLPLSEENLKQIAEAIGMAGSMEPLNDGAVKYLLDNGLEPTLQNIYFAQHCGNPGNTAAEQIDMSAFLPQVEAVIVSAGLQVDEQTLATSQWMLENGIPLTKENLSYAHALRQGELSTDADAMAKLAAEAISEGKSAKEAVILPGYTWMQQAQEAVDTLEHATYQHLDYILDKGLPLTLQSLREAAASQMADRGAAEKLSDTERLSHQAVSGAESVAAASAVQSDTDGTQRELNVLSARRQLEETRLLMTVEASYKLLKSGISIQTEALEQLVQQLREQETSYYRNLLSADGLEVKEEQIELFSEIEKKVSDIKSVPAYVLGIREAKMTTINAVHREGMSLKASFEKANKQYDTLMMPRQEMGDSIQKAFQNVDGILRDIGLEATEENRRAVRILGYNSMEITPDAVFQMKAADEEVQRVFKNMTPSVVLKMIRNEINPLDMDFSVLNQLTDTMQKEHGDADENRKFSEYLWKLEKNHEISKEERSSYIGIYRLMKQVEKTDGAAVGALVQQGAQITMKNLLTAIRSEKRANKMNYFIDDDFQNDETGELQNSITKQIWTGYHSNCIKDVSDLLTPERVKVLFEKQGSDWENMTPEQLRDAFLQAKEQTNEKSLDTAYAKEELEQLKEAANVEEDIYRILEKYDIPNTVSNVLAMDRMTKQRNQMFRKIFGQDTADHTGDGVVDAQDLAAIRQELLEEFGEAVGEPAEMAAAQEKLGDLAEKVMKTMINSEHVTSLDVREMKLLSAQLSVSSMLAKEEQYAVPVMVNDELMNVSVKIVRGADKKGIVDIMLESDLRGKIAATFQAKEDGIHGLIAAEAKETAQLLQEQTQELKQALSTKRDEVSDLHCVYIDNLDLNHFSMGAYGVDAQRNAESEKDSQDYKIQTSRLYGIAEHFIKAIKGTLSEEIM